MPQTEEDKLFEAKVLEILQKNVQFKILRRTRDRWGHTKKDEIIQVVLFIGGKEVSDSMIDITDIIK